ncbi:helix-turn-helix domain-containing protein [Brevibacterium otitidis]|uniref:Helix-turn-helix domain-containing protein n=1 Tax=Brevibacterium otitidis TaxID=53364 RepID=A0ABV5X0F7_9MICO|nr:helix-turn-helix transcriptional regulator [Brevibacterium otitidis]
MSAAPTVRTVRCHLDELLTARNKTLTELSNEVGVTLANLSVLKNNRAKAIRYTTLVALCEALDCQPGDLFTVAEVPVTDF